MSRLGKIAGLLILCCGLLASGVAAAPPEEAEAGDPIAKLLKRLTTRRPEGQLLAAYQLRLEAPHHPDLSEHIQEIYAAAQKRPKLERTANLMLVLLALGDEGGKLAAKLYEQEPERSRSLLIRAYSLAGDRSIPLLRTVLKSISDDDARLAAEMLVPFGPKAAPALPELKKRAKHWTNSLDNVYLRALEAIGPEANDALPEMLAVLAMEGARIDRLLRKGGPDYRRISDSDVARALIRQGKAAVPGLREIVVNEKHRARVAAVMVLAAIGPDAAEAVPDLFKLATMKPARRGRKLTDVQTRLQAASIASLGRMGPEGVKKLLPILATTKIKQASRTKVAGINHAVLNAGAGLQGQLPALFTYLGRGDPGVPNRFFSDAIEAIGPETIPELVKYLSHKKPMSVQLQAADVLSRFGPAAEPAMESLKKMQSRLAHDLNRPGHLDTIVPVVRGMAAIAPADPKVLARLCNTFASKTSSRRVAKYKTMRHAILIALSTMDPAATADKPVEQLLAQWKRVADGAKSVVNRDDEPLMLKVIGRLGSQNEQASKALEKLTVRSKMMPRRMSATVALLDQGVWPNRVGFLFEKARQYRLGAEEISQLCVAIERSPEAERAKELVPSILKMDPKARGRAAAMIAAIDRTAVEALFASQVTSALTRREPRSAEQKEAFAENKRWVLIFVARAGIRTKPSLRAKQAIITMLNDPRYAKEAMEAAQALIKNDEKMIRMVELKRASVMDAALESKLTALLQNAKPANP